MAHYEHWSFQYVNRDRVIPWDLVPAWWDAHEFYHEDRAEYLRRMALITSEIARRRAHG
jgi:hypothetical protein